MSFLRSVKATDSSILCIVFPTNPNSTHGDIFLINLASDIPPVVKSHGSTDYLGFSNSLNVCKKIVEGDLINKIKKNIN